MNPNRSFAFDLKMRQQAGETMARFFLGIKSSLFPVVEPRKLEDLSASGEIKL